MLQWLNQIVNLLFGKKNLMHFLSAFHLWGSTCDLYFLMNKGALLSTREKKQHENKHLGQ